FIATRNPGAIKLDWTPVTNVVISKQSVLWGLLNTNTGAYLSTNTITLPASSQTATITNLATYSTYWFTVTATSVNSVEGPVTDEFRYYVPALPPRGASYFRQVITISTGQ
ncbi:MAG: fibronectin type III domain-containing protein, partial [Rhodoferax sp.]|nr:fibronectin type III domain-containing protein [Rhodoferax sp.]